MMLPTPLRVGRALTIAAALVVGGCSSPDRHAAPILFERCAPCHRPGQAAPFSLLEYPEVKKRATKIVRMTKARLMPPWLPEPGSGEFVGERRLTDTQIATIERWANDGAVEGEAADRPETPRWPEGWQLGQPDLVITMPRA